MGARVGKAGPDRHTELVIAFRKEEDGAYTKITKQVSRDWKTGGISEMKRVNPIEEGPYEIVASECEWDERIEYEDIDGAVQYLHFKKIENGQKEQ